MGNGLPEEMVKAKLVETIRHKVITVFVIARIQHFPGVPIRQGVSFFKRNSGHHFNDNAIYIFLVGIVYPRSSIVSTQNILPLLR